MNVFTLPGKGQRVPGKGQRVPGKGLRVRGTQARGGMPEPREQAALPALLLSVMLAGGDTAAKVTLNLKPTEEELGWPPVTTVKLTALHPGGRTIHVGAATATPEGLWEATVPLASGCAMITATLA